jgi:hypothetical protein
MNLGEDTDAVGPGWWMNQLANLDLIKKLHVAL